MSDDILQMAKVGEDYLEHYGVKGMRWGVRKGEETGARQAGAKDDVPSPIRASTEQYRSVNLPGPKNAQEATENLIKNQEKFAGKSNPSVAGDPDPKGLTPNQKRAVYIGLGAVAVVGIGAAAYYYKKNGGSLDLDFEIPTNPKSWESPFGDTKNSKLFAEQTSKALADIWYNKTGYLHESSYARPEFTIPKGQVFTRVSSAIEDSFGGATYTSFMDDDVSRYVGHMYSDRVGSGMNMYKINFSAAKDVKVPDVTTVLDTLREVMSGQSGKSVAPEEVVKMYNDISGGPFSDPVSKGLFSSLAQKGYSAIVDEMDAGVVSERPLVVFAKEAFTSKTSSIIDIPAVQEARKLVRPLDNLKTVAEPALSLAQGELPMSDDLFALGESGEDDILEMAKVGEEYLAHFGVKGMRWGVRNERSSAEKNMIKASEEVSNRQLMADMNPSISRAQYNALDANDRTIPAGSTFKRITTNPNADKDFDTLFVSTNESDARNYRAQVPLEATGWQIAKKYEGFYETSHQVTRDLTVPSEKARVDAYVDVMKTPSIQDGGQLITGKQFLTRKGLGSVVNKMSEEDFVLANYGRLVKAQGIREDPINKALMTVLKSKGYDALVDDNDRGKLADEPLLLLDAKSSVRTIGVRPLSTADIHNAQATFTPPRKLKHDAFFDDELAALAHEGEAYLEHYGVKGMRWGFRKDKGAVEIKEAAVKPTIDGKAIGSPIKKMDPSIDGKTQDSAHQVAALLKQRYGYEVTEIKAIPQTREFKNYIAYVEADSSNGSKGTINVQPYDMSKMLKDTEKGGWFGPGQGNIRAIMTHETAHSMFHAEQRYERSGFMGLKVTQTGGATEERQKANEAAYAEAKRKGIKRRHFDKSVSGYANATIMVEETEAELFSAYHWNPKAPSHIRVWGETLHKELGVDPTPFHKVVKNG